jgi:hypothetical protein
MVGIIADPLKARSTTDEDSSDIFGSLAGHVRGTAW